MLKQPPVCYFILGTGDLLLDVPAEFWLNTLSFPELQFWWHFLPTHSIKDRKENKSQGIPSLQKGLDLVAARNLLVAPPLPFFSQHPYWREMPLPNPSQSPQWSKLSTLALTGVTRAELQLVLSSSHIREAWTLECHALPRERGASGRSQASPGIHL